ncbi:ribonuclease HII [Leifsonia sp. Root112D2]|jgi:ribonuclease HII|uniref:ribonuclease HII n=1 Tax=Leifsonia sp. Root112D2 TaxID=1736426 RepID=UPI0006FEAD44|nr:ribonuclease HII [Leifsonia sp. Root112D2]KQV07711.1 ribonuclease HII [Leifsonia sp. Root112D2]
MVVADPTLLVEAQLHAGGARLVIGCDEVGRGALAGPVAVGMAVVDVSIGPMPTGLRDSKMLSERRRETMAPLCSEWVLHSAVGLASANEVDSLGITACLGLAGKRALAALHAGGVDILAATVLLDGHHDWLNPALRSRLPVVTRIKGDRDCASVAAASVIAKVHRDRIMIASDTDFPGYGWAGNKGYGSAQHLAAIAELGATELHRRTWLKEPALRSPAA